MSSVQHRQTLTSDVSIHRQVAAINSFRMQFPHPLSALAVYTSHELDRSFEKLPPSSLTATKLPITTPSAALKEIPRKSVESFINAVVGCEGGDGGKNMTTIATTATGIVTVGDNENRGQDIALYELEQPPSCSGSEQSCSKSRCCNILGKGNNHAKQYQVKIIESQTFFDGSGNPVESKGGKCGMMLPLENREILGVETLDILKGVSQGKELFAMLHIVNTQLRRRIESPSHLR